MSDPVGASVDGGSWRFREGDEIVPGRSALRRLGGGRDFEAYLAWDEHRSALVVAKLLRPDLVRAERGLHALTREARMLDLLDHPVIVRSFEAVLDGPRPHLVLEHLEGPTLASAIRRTAPLAADEVLPLAYQVCSALAYLANEGVVHLDVKPRNLVMCAPPRLIDLSVARTVDRARALRMPVGTDAYMAPEQCEPALGEIGPKVDVFGLGASVYHALCGEVPFPRDPGFDREDRIARFPQLVEEPLPLPQAVDPALGRLVLRCLAVDPSERPSAAELAVDVDALIAARARPRILGRPRPRLH